MMLCVFWYCLRIKDVAMKNSSLNCVSFDVCIFSAKIKMLFVCICGSIIVACYDFVEHD